MQPAQSLDCSLIERYAKTDFLSLEFETVVQRHKSMDHMEFNNDVTYKNLMNEVQVLCRSGIYCSFSLLSPFSGFGLQAGATFQIGCAYLIQVFVCAYSIKKSTVHSGGKGRSSVIPHFCSVPRCRTNGASESSLELLMNSQCTEFHGKTLIDNGDLSWSLVFQRPITYGLKQVEVPLDLPACQVCIASPAP